MASWNMVWLPASLGVLSGLWPTQPQGLPSPVPLLKHRRSVWSWIFQVGESSTTVGDFSLEQERPQGGVGNIGFHELKTYLLE